MNPEDCLNDQAKEADRILEEPSKVDEVLKKIEEKLKEVPVIGEKLSDVPLMISMIKSYCTKEYTNVSKKVIALMLGSLLYLIKRRDLIPDNKFLVGYADDIAIITLALKLCDKELNEYKQWREEVKGI